MRGTANGTSEDMGTTNDRCTCAFCGQTSRSGLWDYTSEAVVGNVNDSQVGQADQSGGYRANKTVVGEAEQLQVRQLSVGFRNASGEQVVAEVHSPDSCWHDWGQRPRDSIS